MNKEEILNKYRRSVEIIGSNIQIYGHFDVYSIPDINGKGLRSNTTLEANTDGWSHIDVYQPKDSSKKLLEFNGWVVHLIKKMA